MTKKILILSASAGAGHVRAAAAIEKAFALGQEKGRRGSPKQAFFLDNSGGVWYDVFRVMSR